MLPLLFSHLAWAGGASSDSGESMIMLLVGLFMVAAAYLISRFVVDRLQKKYLFVSGFEYIALGIGLSFIQLFQDEEPYMPAIAFAVGWVGILYGLSGDLRKTLSRPGHEVRLAIIESLVVGLGVGGLSTFFFQQLTGEPGESLACGAMMGCAAAAGSGSAVQVISQRYPSVQSMLLSTLKGAAQLSNIMAIVAFGFLICLNHSGAASISPSTWAWITLGLGMALGLLYSAFLSADATENSRFLALTGIICFTSGAAFFLDISVLTVALFLGIVLANTGHGTQVKDTMAGARKPAILILLVFAGVLCEPMDPLVGLSVCVSYVFLRFLLKAVGGWLATQGTAIRSDIFRGHLAQGEVALAIAISFRIMFEGPTVNLAYTAVIFSVAFSEIFAPRFLRGLLVDAGDIRQDVAADGGV